MLYNNVVNILVHQNHHRATLLQKFKKHKYEGGSKSFRPDIQKPRQMENIATDIQGVSRLVGITAGGDFLGLCDQKSSYKYVSDFGRLRSYDRLNLE